MSANRGPLPGTPDPDNSEPRYLPLEVEMLRFAQAGKQLDLGKGPFELPVMKAWEEERTIRAWVLKQLLVGQQWPVDASEAPPLTAEICGSAGVSLQVSASWPR